MRREDFKLKVAPILIRTGSWIAIGSLILPGVTIGEGAVVSAGSVVLKDVPPNCLVRGNPATVVYEIFRAGECAKSAVAVSRRRDKSLSPSPSKIDSQKVRIGRPLFEPTDITIVENVAVISGCSVSRVASDQRSRLL